MAIRSAAKAIVIRGGKVLLNRCVADDGEVYYDLPGGGQRQYEALEDALVREVLEETGYRVQIVRFAALAEEIHDDVQIREKYADYAHRILHIFITEIAGMDAQYISEMDHQQQGSGWFNIQEADLLNMRPANLTGLLAELIDSKVPSYLGTVHVKY